MRQAGVAAGAETAALAEVEHAHALVARGERVEELGAVVGRRVVDGDELDVGRDEQRLRASLEIGLLAVGDDDEAQQGHARRQANSRRGAVARPARLTGLR